MALIISENKRIFAKSCRKPKNENKNMIRKTLLIATALFFVFLSEMDGQEKLVGGDISLLPTYEEAGVKYIEEGNTMNALDVFADAGWNAERVRVFVDPSKASASDQAEGVRQDIVYATALGKRIKAKNMKLMLDFHYSDTWTDPGQHSTPSAWNSSDPIVLSDFVYGYTLRSLNYMKSQGVTPDYIQPGNEITYGMLWPTGHCYADGSNYGSTGRWANFLKYLQAGIKACKEVFPQAKIVLQTEMSKGANVTNFYNTIGSKVDYDIIGISYYPAFHGALSNLESVISTLETQHGDKEIMIVETGYTGNEWDIAGATQNMSSIWALSEDGQEAYAVDLIGMLNRHSKVTGLFWWMPEDNEYGASSQARSSWWNASLFWQNSGWPKKALWALKDFLTSTGIEKVAREKRIDKTTRYNIAGQKVNEDYEGIVIRNGKKFVVK